MKIIKQPKIPKNGRMPLMITQNNSQVPLITIKVPRLWQQLDYMTGKPQ